MTLHDGNIAAFNTLTKLMISHNIVNLDVPPLYDFQNAGRIQFRGMFVNENQLWTVNGVDSVSDAFVGIFRCDSNRDEWVLEEYFPIASHPYGIGFHSGYGWMLVSSQKDNTISILDGGRHLVHSIAPNITVKVGFRGLACDSDLDLIFVASPDSNNILVFDVADGFRNSFNISLPTKRATEPISVLLNEEKVVFISDRATDKVFAFDYWKNGSALKWTSQFNSWLRAPTGLALDGHHLFVISQKLNRILVLSSETGRFEGDMVDWRELTTGMGKGEQLLFVEQGHRCALN